MLATQILEILFGAGTTREQVQTAAEVAQVRVQDLLRSACDVALEHGDISNKSAAYSAACREMGLSS
jgi:hypothetical protein